MLYKLISAKTIIREVISRFGITDGNIEYDALEWIGYAVGLIGTHINYVNIVETIDVDFFKIPYPENFYQLNFIAYNGKKLQYGSRGSHGNHTTPSKSDDPLVVDLIESIFVKQGLAKKIEATPDCTPEAEDLLNKQELLNNRIKNLADFLERSSILCENYWYSNSKGNECFDTNIESGQVYISYKAYPVDDEGYPLIIDEVNYKLALEWYVFRSLLERGYVHPVIDYAMADAKCRIHIARASNEHLKMTYEEAEDFTHNWTNMLFQLNPSHRNYYSN